MNMNKTIGYKLFEMNSKGQLFPLFIGKNEETRMNEWLHAEYIPTRGFATRGGWHVGLVPDAPWLKSYDGTDVGFYKSQRWKHGKRVWCEVEFNSNHNYDEEVMYLPKKCFVDKCPDDGYYKFKESGDREWIVSSDIKVIRIIDEDERHDILNKMNYDEVEAYKKYKAISEKKLKALKKQNEC